MLAIGRGLMRSPKLMLLDEPSLGLALVLVDQGFATTVQINKESVPILIVEQNARKALNIADHAHILEVGQVVLSGPARELAADERVRQAYLGGATYERRLRAKESGTHWATSLSNHAPPQKSAEDHSVFWYSIQAGWRTNPNFSFRTTMGRLVVAFQVLMRV